MLEWIRHLRQRWDDWCGDREMELSIRKQLTINGYYGGTARLRNVRLVAVQRPGWLQVFRFEATVRVIHKTVEDDIPDPQAEYQEVYGLVRDDIRHKINVVRVFESDEDRYLLFHQWSDGLICLRGAHGLKTHSNASSPTDG